MYVLTMFSINGLDIHLGRKPTKTRNVFKLRHKKTQKPPRLNTVNLLIIIVSPL